MIKYSIAVLATLVFIGCGSSSKEDSTNTEMSDAQKLAYAIANKQEVLNSTTPSKQSRASLPCDSGTMIVPFSLEDMQDPYFDYENAFNNITFNNCKYDDETLNGSMKMELNENGEGRISFPQGFSITGGEDSGSIKAGGTIDIEQDGEWEVATINMEMTMDGVIHGGENLVYKSKDLANGSYIEYPVSGKEKIGDSSYFTVDPTYDASATPFTTNLDGKLVSGLFKYIDDKDHAVELEITGEDKVTVRVDEDGNGLFVGDEVTSIDL